MRVALYAAALLLLAADAPAGRSSHGGHTLANALHFEARTFNSAGQQESGTMSTTGADIRSPFVTANLASACTTTSVSIRGVQNAVTIGSQSRCFTVYVPETAPRPAPVLIHLHDDAADAIDCARNNGHWVHEAYAGGFALVCAEASATGYGGAYDNAWQFGMHGVVHDENANPCLERHSNEIPFFRNIFNHLSAAGTFNMERLYISGDRTGGAMAAYVASCFPARVAGFTQFSQGLKLKGDGASMPGRQGECDACEYWPAKIFPSHALGRAFTHCTFIDGSDSTSGTLATNMCDAMADGDHYSRLFAFQADTGHPSSSTMPALAAYCFGIGRGATPLPPLPPPKMCTAQAKRNSDPVRIVRSQRLALMKAKVADPCPLSVGNLSSLHQCPCLCDGILPSTCANQCAEFRGVPAGLIVNVSNDAPSTGEVCAPHTRRADAANRCFSSAVVTAKLGRLLPLKVVVHSCPDHPLAAGEVGAHRSVALFQQYSFELPVPPVLAHPPPAAGINRRAA